jgi:predicted  nucleic acid-binding Zn-ribbon protein
LKLEINKNTENTNKIKSLQDDVDMLESRLADSEVAAESSQDEITKLTDKSQNLERRLEAVTNDNLNKAQEILLLQETLLQSQESLKKQYENKIEESKYDLFSNLMKGFEEERRVLDHRHLQTQRLLAQATKVSMLSFSL